MPEDVAPPAKRKKRRRRGMGHFRVVWLTVYNDMTTNLMLFFLLMFAISLLTEDEKQEAMESLHAAFTEEKGDYPDDAMGTEELAAEFSDMEKGFIEVHATENEVRIILPSEVLFDLGSAELKDESKRVLRGIADKLQSLPNLIVVYGHTDDIPIGPGGRFRSNWELSLARSHSVVLFLHQRAGIEASRLAVSGQGETRPLFPNDTPANRRRNRRIGIRILGT